LSRRHRSGNRFLFVFCRNSWVADFVVVKIYHVQAFAMFAFALAEIMQKGLPLIVLLEIFCGMFRNEDVTGIAAIHDALGDVDPSTGYVCLLVQVGDFVDRTTVDTHAHPNLGMTLECLAISSAQSTGASGLLRKASAPPS